MKEKNLHQRNGNTACRLNFIKVIFKGFLCISLIVFLGSYAFAAPPSGPPPAGKVWIEREGNWILVPAPPGDGPYMWTKSKWIVDPTPPPANSDWVPGHWQKDKWIPGHWEVMQSPGPGHDWVPGHWKNGRWVSGHWKGGPRHGKKWRPAHRDRGGHWVPGHWR